ncbi:hypothetical protein ACFL1E_02565 [Candidatus Omnitrophota bacterium]
MRELLFKNLTSVDKGRKILSLSEVFTQNGVVSHISRKFIYFIKEVPAVVKDTAEPQFYIFKQQDSKQKVEEIFIKIKGHLYTFNGDGIFLVSFCHSLKINIAPHTHPAGPNAS